MWNGGRRALMMKSTATYLEADANAWHPCRLNTQFLPGLVFPLHH
jgi:hypothetical protein